MNPDPLKKDEDLENDVQGVESHLHGLHDGQQFCKITNILAFDEDPTDKCDTDYIVMKRFKVVKPPSVP